MQVAGLTAPKDAGLFDEAVRFTARPEPTAELTPEESAALEAFVAVLSEQRPVQEPLPHTDVGNDF